MDFLSRLFKGTPSLLPQSSSQLPPIPPSPLPSPSSYHPTTVSSSPLSLPMLIENSPSLDTVMGESKEELRDTEEIERREEERRVRRRKREGKGVFKEVNSLRLDRMTLDKGNSESSRDSTSSTELVENNESLGSPRSFELLFFTSDSLNFVGREVNSKGRDRYIQIGRQYDLSFKMVRSDSKLVKTILYSYGFTQVSARNPSFNILWTSCHLRPHALRSLRPWQRVNHFPRSGELTRKDRLYENMQRSRALFGDAFDFIPEFFVTPRDIDAFAKSLEGSRSSPQFIVKPVSSSRGRGIFFVSRPDEVPLASPLLVSRYISNPLLVKEHKFDVRIYVAVTSFHPLIAYVYTEGLTRLASEKYSYKTNVENEFVHLTNYSVNKNSKNFIRNETFTSEDYGHKWTLGALLRHLEERNIDSRMLMIRMEDVMVKSLLSVQNTISASSRSLLLHPSVCFELFGFDILIDENLKPWLLEVNMSPSLTCDAPLDSVVKTKLMCDLFNLASIQLISKKALSVSITHDNDNPNNEMHLDELSESGGTPSIAASNSTLGKASPTKKVLSKALPSQRKKNVKGWVGKCLLEDSRKGDFLRLFPRKNSLRIYGHLMEYVGSEKWDEKLHRRLYAKEGGEEEEGEGREEGLDNVIHHQLINTKKFPRFNDLSPSVAALLEDSYISASEYCERLTKEGEVYRNRLPSVRMSARQRTKSCVEWYELRENNRVDEDIKRIVENRVQVATAKESLVLPPLAPSPVNVPLQSSVTRHPDSIRETVSKMTLGVRGEYAPIEDQEATQDSSSPRTEAEEMDALVSRYTELLLLEGLKKVVEVRAHSTTGGRNSKEVNGALQLMGFASENGVKDEIIKSKVKYLLWRKQSYGVRERVHRFSKLSLTDCERLLEEVNRQKKRFTRLPPIV